LECDKATTLKNESRPEILRSRKEKIASNEYDGKELMRNVPCTMVAVV
jgi:hypothetical protein